MPYLRDRPAPIRLRCSFDRRGAAATIADTSSSGYDTASSGGSDARVNRNGMKSPSQVLPVGDHREYLSRAHRQVSALSAADPVVSYDVWQHRLVVEVGGRLDVVRLGSILESRGVRRDAYSLSGGHPSECYVIDERESGYQWVVYYSERGHDTGLESFANEDLACRHLLDLIDRDATTRQRPVK